MIIRTWREDDLPKILKIEEEAFQNPLTFEMLLREYHNPQAVYLVAEENGESAGYGGFWSVAGEAQVMNIAVRKKWRRQGVGRSLLSSLCAAAKEMGCASMSLEVREGNLPAIALYENFGFSVVGVRKGYYRDNRENAKIMERIF